MAISRKSQKNSQRVAIVRGVRTPFAKQSTAYKNMSALELGKASVKGLLDTTDIDPKMIQQVVYGQVILTPQVPNIARDIVIANGMDVATDAYSVTRACATSYQATVNVAESIMAGTIDVGIAGGADSSSMLPILFSESFSQSLLALSKARTLSQRWNIIKKIRLKDLAPVPPAVKEFSTGISMGETAEQMAKTHHISRADQDAFSYRSHQLAAQAWEQGKMAQQVMTMRIPPYQDHIAQDNLIRAESSLASYEKLKPVFDRKHGSVTAANSSPLTDGASAVLLMRESVAKSMGLTPIGYLKSYAFSAIDVLEDMLMGPSYAVPMALDRAQLTLKDIDLIDMHEAFASQVLANLKMFESKQFAKDKLNRTSIIGKVDMDKFNVLGGSLAYGHPFAATGVRLIVQLCHELKLRGGGFGLTTGCAAGGLGAALVVEVDG